MASWKESMINRLSNLINRNRSAAKISQVLCSSGEGKMEGPEPQWLCSSHLCKTFDKFHVCVPPGLGQ